MGLLKKAGRAARKAVKVVTRPIAKALDKVVPNELKPFLPYVAAVAPFMLPAGGLASLPFASNPAVQRALLSGSIQLGSQLAQEGSEGDFDILPLALAAGSGYLSTPGATDQLLTTKQAIDPAMSASQQAKILGERSLLTQAKDLGITGLQKAGEFMSAPVREGGPGIFSAAGVKAASVPLTGQTTQDAINFAKQAEADYLAELAEFNRLAGEQQEASDADRRSAITASMLRANFTQDVIDETLDQLGLLLKDGGRVGYQAGGRASLQDFQNALQSVSAGTTYDQQRQAKEFARNEANRMLTEAFKSGTANQLADQFGLQNLKFDRGPSAFGRSGPIIGLDQRNRQGILDAMTAQMLNFNTPTSSIEIDSLTGLPVTDLLPNNPDGSMKSLAEQERIRQIVLNAQQAEQDEIDRLVAQDTGVASFKDGGIMDLGGKEMDMRGGGFIPIGAKERADDVPARLSKNEFVMTADAVRAAGGGSVNKGAKRMYNLMHKLEARA